MRFHAVKQRAIISLVVISLLAVSQSIFHFAAPRALADSRPAEDRGAAGLGQAIKRLGTIASVLHTGAHPDDEDSGLLAYLARGRQARTAYLSLTRGDGGQNLIGPELYEALGVIRTEELLAARRLDGAQQFFTRAFDFGFSKSPKETLAKWDRDAVLGDMVRVIRTFRPLIIVSAWTGTPTDGHGHHQAAGLLIPEAYRAAGDPSRYPEQLTEGLKPWQAKKFYIRVPQREELQRGQEPPPATVTLDKGQYDALLGRSYNEIAMQGRSQHRSQDQGAIERRGPQYSKLRLIESTVGKPEKEQDIFDNLDVKLTGLAEFAGQAAARLKTQLVNVQQVADEALAKYNPLVPNAVTPILARGLKRIREIRAGLSQLRLNDAERYETDYLLQRKEDDFSDALAKSQGLVVDCLADDEIITPGQSLTVNVQCYADPGTKISGVSLVAPAGWASAQQKANNSVVDGRLIAETDYKVTVAADAEPTSPYWLKNPRNGDMFVPGKGGTGIEPNAPPFLSAKVEFEIAGEKITLTQAAQYRFADKALGEIRREVKVAPGVSVNVSPPFIVIPTTGNQVKREVTVTVTNNQKDGARGTVKLQDTEGWPLTPAQAEFDLKREGEKQSLTFIVTAPTPRLNQPNGIKAVAQTTDGHRYQLGYQRLLYPHIESRLVYDPAKIYAESIDVKVAPGLKVGYIEGAGDDFANALKRLDVNVHTIDANELAAGDLSQYDAIVAGIRVYEVRPDVIANNARLLDYVKQGGTFIVQYNKNEIANGNFTPYPVKMGRGMPDRVTDETAAVEVLDATSPLFNFPNKITASDFQGWVQERGAYFFSEWDAQFKPLLASHDPDEKDKQGGELIATYGKGYYIYTAYAWFRQLPQGVPGAYRLIANLVSFPKAPKH